MMTFVNIEERKFKTFYYNVFIIFLFLYTLKILYLNLFYILNICMYSFYLNLFQRHLFI